MNGVVATMAGPARTSLEVLPCHVARRPFYWLRPNRRLSPLQRAAFVLTTAALTAACGASSAKSAPPPSGTRETPSTVTPAHASQLTSAPPSSAQPTAALSSEPSVAPVEASGSAGGDGHAGAACAELPVAAVLKLIPAAQPTHKEDNAQTCSFNTEGYGPYDAADITLIFQDLTASATRTGITPGALYQQRKKNDTVPNVTVSDVTGVGDAGTLLTAAMDDLGAGARQELQLDWLRDNHLFSLILNTAAEHPIPPAQLEALADTVAP